MSGPLGNELEALGEVAEQLAAFNRARALNGADARWAELDPRIEGEIEGRRVLVVGIDVRDDAEAFAARGATRVLACASLPTTERSAPSSEAGMELLQLSWQELDPGSHGSFDLGHCDGLLHRVTEPLRLLRTLRSMTVPGGILLIGSMVLTDPERSEYLRFVPDRYAADPTWWFLPGRLAFRWMVQTAGFEVVAEFGEREGPQEPVPVAAEYLKAVARS